MTNYANIDALKRRVYFHSATLDDRYTWEKLTPSFGRELREQHPELTTEQHHELDMLGVTMRPEQVEWADGLDRYRMVGCAHRPVDRDGALCTHCGADVDYTPAPEPAPLANKRRKRLR